MGNKLGWVIAGIFGGFVVIVLVKVILLPSASSPTSATLGPGKLTLQKPEKPLTSIIPAEPSGEGDAGDDYQKAIEIFDENAGVLSKIFQHHPDILEDKYRLTADEIKLLKRLADPIADGAARKKMTYYFRLTPKKIEIPYWADEAERFVDIAQVPLMLFAYHFARGEQEYTLAEKYLFDLMVMGHHLIAERARLDLVQIGVELQKDACDQLDQLYVRWKKPDRARAVRAYCTGLLMMDSTYDSLSLVIWRLKQHKSGAMGPNPGDIFNLVENHADRAVRVEAILGLGVVKLTCTKRGDHKKVRALIDEKLTGGDPIEKAAAECANALDKDGFNRLVNAK